MTRTRSALLAILTIGCLTVVASAQACTETWRSATSGSWGNAKLWNPSSVPVSTDEVCITAAGTYTVTLPPNGGVAKTLTVGGGAGEVTIDVAGESYDNAGNTSNETDLSILESATFAANTKLILEATTASTEAKVEPHGAGGGLVGGSVVESGQIEAVNKGAPWANRVKLANLQIEPGASLLDASGTLLFLKEGEGAYPWSLIDEGTFTVATGASVEMKTSFAGSASFTNDGSVVNDGSIAMNGTSGNATWTQSGGSVAGNEVLLQNGATLADAAGTGRFLADSGGATVTGTIPAGQTVTARGAPFDSGGENYYETKLSLAGKQLVNDGELVLEAPGSGEGSGGSAFLIDGSLQNNGRILAQIVDPAWADHLEAGLTNGPAGTLEVLGGSLDQTAGTATTNEGLLTLTPGALYLLDEGSSFTNAGDGTVSPQIASATSFGAFQLSGPCCNGPGTLAAGGTLLPVLVDGFVPAANQEFKTFLLSGGALSGTFAAVGNGFSADYSHETAEGPYVGVVYHATGATPTTTGAGTTGKPAPLAHVAGKGTGRDGKITVTLSCPPGGAACAATTLQATLTEHLKGRKITAIAARRRKQRTHAQTRQVVIASASASLAAGATTTLTVALNATGRALLATYGKLTTKVTISSGATTLETAVVTLHAPKKPKRTKKK